MKKRHMLAILFIVLCLSIAGKYVYTIYASEYEHSFSLSSTSTDVNTLRVATYNIKSLNYEDSISLFQKEVQDANLDIIALQEVDKNALRSGTIDQVKELAEANEYPYYHFYTTTWMLYGYYGIGILSKYPIIEMKAERMPNSILKESRILSETTIQIGNEQMHVFNTHVTYENNEYRQQQLRFIEDRVENKSNTILLGDFNAFGSNGALSLPSMMSINSNQEFVTFRNTRSPDNIYYSSEFTLRESDIIKSTFSDHDLLYAELEIK